MAFGALALVVLAVSVLDSMALSAANGRFFHYTEGQGARATIAAQVRAAVDDRAVAARNLVLVTKDSDLAVEKAAVLRAHKEVQDSLASLVKHNAEDEAVSDKGRAAVAAIAKVEQAYGPVALAIVDLSLNQKREEAIILLNE